MIKNLHTWPRMLAAFCLMLLANSAMAQVHVSHLDGWFYIPDTLSVHVKGSLSSLEGNENPLLNLGKMYISDSVSCFGDNKVFGDEPDTTTAEIYLNGDSLQIISGDKNIRFGNLYVQNSYDSIELRNNVEIYNKVQLDSGNVYVHDFKTLDFLYTGRLIGERNEARLFGNNYGEIKITRPLLFGQTYDNIGGLGFGLTINGNLGISTEITRKNVAQLNVSNGSIDRFYAFKPEKNAYVSNPRIHYLDTIELNGNLEEGLNLYASNTLGNTWTKLGGQVDTISDVVESTNAAPFVLSDQTMLSLAEQKCLASPYLEFAKDTIPLCGGNSAWLRPEGIVGMSSVWSTGVENKDSILVESAGVYYVTITNVMGCSSLDSVVVIYASVPNVKFSVDPVCEGTVSEFNNLSTITSGQMTYRWDLGDLYTEEEDTSTLIDPKLKYQKQGVFHVQLTAESNYGCVSEIEQTARVNAYPVVDFSILNNCADSLVQLNNLTKVYPDTTINYNWDFGDNLSSTDSVPMHYYATSGTYQIELTANALGCESVLSKEIIIHPNPVATFIAEDVCFGEQVQFDNQSTVPSTGNTYLWQFDEENTAVIENPNYEFDGAGNYTVSLTATTNNGCSDDTSIHVSVFALPTPDFIALETCERAAMQFTNTASNSSDFNWDFNDEGSADDFEPEFTFNTYGTKQVLLTETDSNACIASISKEVTIKAMPKVEFISTNTCQGEEVRFTNKSVSPEGEMSYQWSIANTPVDVSTHLTNEFTQAGSYAIKLVASTNGCSDSLEHTTIVYEAPVLDLGTSISSCADQYVLDALNEGSTYVWSNASTDQQLTAVNSGTYTVEVTTDDGCAIRDTVEVKLKSVVKPNLGSDNTFCDYTELDAGYPGSQYLWSTGETTQQITVNESNTYWVQVWDQNACAGADTIILTIVQSVVPDLGSDQTACDGEMISLTSGSDSYNYQWNTNETSSNIVIGETGTYWCQLTDANGCVSSDTIDVLFYKNPSINLGSDTHYCDSVLFDISDNNLSYKWDNGSPEGERAIYESGEYWAQVKDETTGCTSHDTVVLTVSDAPKVYLGDDYSLCNGSSVVLDAGNVGSTFSWNVGATTASIIAAASGYYSVEVSSPEGCIGADTIAVDIDDPLDTYLGKDFILCNNTETEISSPMPGALSYDWYLNDSALNTNQQTIIVDKQGALSVTVHTEKGCSVSDTIELLESNIELHANYLVATSNIYVGDTLQFINLSSPEPYSSYWEYGDGYFSSHDSPDHIYYFKGKYIAQLEIDNGVCTDTISKVIQVLPQRPAIEDIPDELNEIVSINIYPNPSSNEINLDVSLKQDDQVFIECINVYGISIFNDIQYGTTIKVGYQIASYMPGIYFLQVRIPDQTIYMKFIKN